jgi:hypothetical protein
MEVRRNFFEAEIVLFVAVGATHIVEMLPFRLLRGKSCPGFAAKQNESDRNTHRCFKPHRAKKSNHLCAIP